MAHLPYDIVNSMDMIGGKCIVNPNTVVDIPLYVGCTFANIFGFSIIFEIKILLITLKLLYLTHCGVMHVDCLSLLEDYYIYSNGYNSHIVFKKLMYIFLVIIRTRCGLVMRTINAMFENKQNRGYE